MNEFAATAADLDIHDAPAAEELGRRIYEIGASLTIRGTAESQPDVVKAGEMLTAAGESIRKAAHSVAQAAKLLKNHQP